MLRRAKDGCTLGVTVFFIGAILLQLAGHASEPKLRRPVAIDCSIDGSTAFIANRDSGTISVVDVANSTVTSEITVGGNLSDLAVVSANRLLVLDRRQHRMLSLSHKDSQWRVESSIDVPGDPCRMVVDRARNRCYVASRWARCVTAFEVPILGPLKQLGTAELPMEPLEMCLLSEQNKLVVTGAFAAYLSVLDGQTLRMESCKSLPGHNVRGLAVGPDDTLQLAMQELNPLAHSTRDDVHWGNMISNLLVSIPLEAVLDPSSELEKHRMVTLLGEPGQAAGDPGRLVFDGRGNPIVLISGVSQVALGEPDGAGRFEMIAIGSRPTACAMHEGALYVANMFSDTVSIVDVEKRQLRGTIALGTLPDLTPPEKGEMLFFDSRLSLDGWMSCHSCHSDGHTNGQINDNLSDGGFGDAKLVPSLLGIAETAPYGWTGEVPSLSQQVHNSVENTMHGRPLSVADSNALVAFLETLSLPRLVDTPTSERIASDDLGIKRGRGLFQSLECANCHVPPTFTSAKSFDVGLRDAVGNKRFNPPSLRGVKHRARYLHDGRAMSLVEVLSGVQHQLPTPLGETDVEDLLAYLRSL